MALYILTAKAQNQIRQVLAMSVDNTLKDIDYSAQVLEEIEYNSQKGNLNGFYGKTHLEETKKLIGRQKIGNLNFLGRKHSASTKEKMSKAKKGKTSNRKGKIPWNKGISMSEESKFKLSRTKLGKKFSETAKRNMSIAFQNRPKFECHKCGKKMTASNLKRWHGEKCKNGV